MSIAERLIAATNTLEIDVGKLRLIVQGDENTVVETEGGPVTSLAKLEKDLRAMYGDALQLIKGITTLGPGGNENNSLRFRSTAGLVAGEAVITFIWNNALIAWSLRNKAEGEVSDYEYFVIPEDNQTLIWEKSL